MYEQVFQENQFCGFFSPTTVLVPVPNASIPSTVGTARKLAWALHATGLAGAVWSGLIRVIPVAKSARCCLWERPTVPQHYQSLAVLQSRLPPTEIVIVDDVITKGRTLIAAAMRLHEAFPEAQIRAFALIRTMSLIPEVERVIAPCTGEISWNGRDARREP